MKNLKELLQGNRFRKENGDDLDEKGNIDDIEEDGIEEDEFEEDDAGSGRNPLKIAGKVVLGIHIAAAVLLVIFAAMSGFLPTKYVIAVAAGLALTVLAHFFCTLRPARAARRHADGLVRQVEGNTVLLNNLCNHEGASKHRERNLEVFRERGIEYIELDYGPGYHGVNDWAYLNFLRVGDIIFMPTIERPDVDGEALRQLSAIYGCKVVPVPFLSVVKANGKYGGGALNCVSWTVRQ